MCRSSICLFLPQNVGIATSLALTMFKGAELNDAMGVPFLYGMAEIFFISIYCLVAWKSGWTKAPANESICKVIATSYEVGAVDDASDDGKESRTSVDGGDACSDDGKGSHDGDATAMTGSDIGSP